jgi:hypothetical protein
MDYFIGYKILKYRLQSYKDANDQNYLIGWLEVGKQLIQTNNNPTWITQTTL